MRIFSFISLLLGTTANGLQEFGAKERNVKVPLKIGSHSILETLKIEGYVPVDQDYANSLTDQGLKRIEQFMIEQEYDPLELPDDHAEFGYTLIVDYEGGIDLYNGHLHDLHTIHREDDVTVLDTSARGFYLAYVPADFNDLKITYNYSASIMGLSPRGTLECTFRDVHLRLSVYYHLIENYVTLITVDIRNAGDVDINFTGNALTDWLHDLLIDSVADILKKRFLNLLKDIVTDSLNNLFDEVNLNLGSF